MASRRKTQEDRPYHHGDLRAALLEAALGMLAEGGVGTVTLREVARRAGVTHAAPYRHFPNKEALLAAVAEEGFRQMHREMLERLAPHGDDPRAQLSESGVAYVLFAVRHPAHLRLMFGAELECRPDHPGLLAASQATFQVLLDAITRCQARGVIGKGDPMQLALAAWSTVHGLAMLLIENQLGAMGADASQAEALARGVVDVLGKGLLAR